MLAFCVGIPPKEGPRRWLAKIPPTNWEKKPFTQCASAFDIIETEIVDAVIIGLFLILFLLLFVSSPSLFSPHAYDFGHAADEVAVVRAVVFCLLSHTAARGCPTRPLHHGTHCRARSSDPAAAAARPTLLAPVWKKRIRISHYSLCSNAAPRAVLLPSEPGGDLMR